MPKYIVEVKRTETIHIELDLPDDVDGELISLCFAKGVAVDGRAPQGVGYKRTLSAWEY